MNSVRTRKTHAKGKPRKKVEPLDEGIAGKRKGRYDNEELNLVRKKYAELIQEGLNDNQIAKIICKLVCRRFHSVLAKIREMRKKGELEENPNKRNRKEFSEEEIVLIKRKYTELVQEGLNDGQIARKISDELKREYPSLSEKIRKLRDGGTIGENPNKKKKTVTYSDEEIVLIKRRYLKLVKKGLNDTQISREIGKELKRHFGSVRNKIRQLKESGGIRKNPNKQREFSEEEVEIIKRRYAELVQEGLNDKQIARIISEELEGRSVNSVKEKIRQMKMAGEFADAEALREREDILGVVEALEEFEN